MTGWTRCSQWVCQALIRRIYAVELKVTSPIGGQTLGRDEGDGLPERLSMKGVIYQRKNPRDETRVVFALPHYLTNDDEIDRCDCQDGTKRRNIFRFLCFLLGL